MPLAPKLTKFSTASPILATFDFVDIADGTVKIKFFGYAATDSSGITYHLTTDSSIVAVPRSTVKTSDGTVTINFNLTPFNAPRTLTGTATFGTGFDTAGGAFINLTAQLIHYDGSETAITSEISTGVLSPGAPTMFLIQLPITEKRFRKGDKLILRLKIEKGGGTSNIIYHDPANITAPAAGVTSTTQLTVPFLLDL